MVLARPGRADARSTSTRSSARLTRARVRAGRAVAARDRHSLGGRSVRAPTPASASDLAPWLADAQINRDRNLRLQYLAGLGLNLYQNAAIYDDILVHRKFPEDLFSGSEERLGQLRAAVQRFGN